MSAEINELVGDILTPPGFDDFLDALPGDFEGLDFEDGFLHAQAADQAILSCPIPDYGRSSPSWLSFLKKFASATVYSKRVDTFLQWHHNMPPHRESTSTLTCPVPLSMVHLISCRVESSFKCMNSL